MIDKYSFTGEKNPSTENLGRYYVERLDFGHYVVKCGDGTRHLFSFFRKWSAILVAAELTTAYNDGEFNATTEIQLLEPKELVIQPPATADKREFVAFLKSNRAKIDYCSSGGECSCRKFASDPAGCNRAVLVSCDD